MFKRDKDDLEGREGQRATNDDGLTAGPDDASAPGPADSTPSEQAAPEAPPTDEAPTDEAPTDEAPTDEAPTDEAPAEPDAPEEPSALDAAAAEAAVPEPTPPPRPAGNRVRQLSDDPDISALLRRLDDVARSASDAGGSGMRRATEEVQQHNEALAATSSARQEAQRLLALATEERERAATAGASIIDEARQIAARLTGEAQSHAADAMAEIQRWATGQRASIASVVSDLTEAAQREADEIREEAHATALDDARTAAETYVARAAAIGVRDAERHRAEAAQALSRTADVVTAAHGTLQDFAATMATFVDSMTGHLTTLQEVVEQSLDGNTRVA